MRDIDTEWHFHIESYLLLPRPGRSLDSRCQAEESIKSDSELPHVREAPERCCIFNGFLRHSSWVQLGQSPFPFVFYMVQDAHVSICMRIYEDICLIPVVLHKAVAEVSEIANL